VRDQPGIRVVFLWAAEAERAGALGGGEDAAADAAVAAAAAATGGLLAALLAKGWGCVGLVSGDVGVASSWVLVSARGATALAPGLVVSVGTCAVKGESTVLHCA